MSCRIRAFIAKRNVTWPKLLDYTASQLMVHLEKQFTKGMTWENYGKHGWHIDHIVPVSDFYFSSTKDFEFKVCWSLANLRPYWAKDNWAKKDKRTHLL